MVESMVDPVACPKCKKVFRLKELIVRNGAYIGPSPEGGDIYQIDYFCPRPECGKVVVCDTNGKGNLVVQQGAADINSMEVIMSGLRK